MGLLLGGKGEGGGFKDKFRDKSYIKNPLRVLFVISNFCGEHLGHYN